MRIAFFGTPEEAVPSLDALLEAGHEVVVAVTQPDRPRGRGRAVAPSPVKAIAEARGIPLLQPATPKEERFAGALAAVDPELLTVVAYGHILPPGVLSVARALNVHFSLLPRYRGAAPVQRALMDGATETGVSVFLLEPTVDTGPVLLREGMPVGPEETTGEVLARLAPRGARLLVRAVAGIETFEPQTQDPSDATAAPKIRPEEAEIDWRRSPVSVVNLVRALNPRPGAFTVFRGRRLGIWRARAASGAGEPGSVLDQGGPVVASGEGAVALVEVQPEGKRRMAGEDFARGYRPARSERFGARD